MANPLNSYINLARIVFSVEPAEPNEVWDEFEEFEEKLREFYENLLCKNCKQLLNDPCTPKKQHFSCHHRVCLDCIGKNRATTLNCKMCRDFTLFEKSSQTKIVLRLYKELCELIKGSWIYDYIQRRTNHDTGQHSSTPLIEIIENGINYGRINTINIVEDSASASSSDENSNSSIIKPINVKKEEKSPQLVPYYQQQTFPTISPLPPCSPNPLIVQSSEQFPVIQQDILPAIESIPTPPLPMPQITTPTIISPLPAPKITIPAAIPNVPNPPLPPILKSTPPTFISHVPMRVKSIAQQQQVSTTQMTTKSIMSPMKIQQAAPTIYSVMYTGSGNKITLKRKAPDDNASIPNTSDLSSTSNNNVSLLILFQSQCSILIIMISFTKSF